MSYLATTSQTTGRIAPEQRSASCRNAGRHQIGLPVGIPPERRSASAGIRTPEGKERLRVEKTVVSDIKSKIETSNSYAKLTSKQKQSLIEGREWRLKGWKKIALSAGLSEVHSDDFYTYLCSYAHAGSLSVLQMRQCETAAHQQGLVGATMGLAMICIAYMTKAYCTYFPKSCSVLENNEHHMEKIQMWTEIGASNLEDVDVDWEVLNG